MTGASMIVANVAIVSLEARSVGIESPVSDPHPSYGRLMREQPALNLTVRCEKDYER